MFTIEELKQDAVLAATEVELNWEKLEDQTEESALLTALNKATTLLPDLESLYTKLINGKSVLLPDEDSSLSYEDKEKYSSLVAEELYAAYVLLEVKDKYEKINSIIKLATT
jgi:hypothetical protein